MNKIILRRAYESLMATKVLSGTFAIVIMLITAFIHLEKLNEFSDIVIYVGVCLVGYAFGIVIVFVAECYNQYKKYQIEESDK